MPGATGVVRPMVNPKPSRRETGEAVEEILSDERHLEILLESARDLRAGRSVSLQEYLRQRDVSAASDRA